MNAASPSWIDRGEDIAPLCERAAEAGRVAFDTEADSFHSYFHKLCLIQLSFADTHALIDPLRLGRDELQPLAALLEDPAVVVLMHGADYDMRVLDRDLGAHPRGLRDTELAARLLGEPKTGLASLLDKELGLHIDKQYQRADWGRRPLPAGMRSYAVADTAHLAELTDRLEARLVELAREKWWLEECEVIEQVRFEPPDRGPLAFERVKGARKLEGEARDRIAALFDWREELAAKTDRPPFHILSPKTMIELAARPPADLGQLGSVPGIQSSISRRQGEAVLSLLVAPPPAPPKTARGGKRERNPARERRSKALRDAVAEVAKGLAIEPSVLAPRAAIDEVAVQCPRDEAALAGALGRRWRASVLADALLPIVTAS